MLGRVGQEPGAGEVAFRSLPTSLKLGVPRNSRLLSAQHHGGPQLLGPALHRESLQSSLCPPGPKAHKRHGFPSLTDT